MAYLIQIEIYFWGQRPHAKSVPHQFQTTINAAFYIASAICAILLNFLQRTPITYIEDILKFNVNISAIFSVAMANRSTDKGFM